MEWHIREYYENIMFVNFYIKQKMCFNLWRGCWSYAYSVVIIWYWFEVPRSHRMEDTGRNCHYFLTKYLCRKGLHSILHIYHNVFKAVFTNICIFLILNTPWLLLCPCVLQSDTLNTFEIIMKISRHACKQPRYLVLLDTSHPSVSISVRPQPLSRWAGSAVDWGDGAQRRADLTLGPVLCNAWVVERWGQKMKLQRALHYSSVPQGFFVGFTTHS